MNQLRRIHKTSSVTQKTYRSLERAIAQNRLVPGQVLVIADLAEELGVSRTPVREALLMLEKAGLVKIANGRMAVTGLSQTDLDEVFEFREAIELFCLEKVAEHAPPDRISRLRHIVSEHVGAEPAGAEEAAAADLKFHRSVVALADNGRLLGAWDQMATHLQRFWQDGRANLGRVKLDIDDCMLIVRALEEGDVATASSLLREHLRQTKAALSAWQHERRSEP
jgi:GntR family transcriptional regulator, gluconate operon transcriptional repressor